MGSGVIWPSRMTASSDFPYWRILSRKVPLPRPMVHIAPRKGRRSGRFLSSMATGSSAGAISRRSGSIPALKEFSAPLKSWIKPKPRKTRKRSIAMATHTTNTKPQLTLPVTERDHIQGPATAPVTLVEYGDYQCPYCGQAHPIVKELQQRLGNRLRFV